jgi:peptidoglycan hydrolase CwlO-like protein
MSWEIITGLITLVTFGVAICKIVSNNTKVITELRSSVDTLNATLQEQKEEQKEIREKVDKHETQICVINEKLEHITT